MLLVSMKKKTQVYNSFNNKFGGWVKGGGGVGGRGDIMHVADIGGHLPLGYTYQISFGTRPTKECFRIFKKEKELRTKSFEM